MKTRTVSNRTRILRATQMVQVRVNKLRFWPEERAELTTLANPIRRGHNHNEKKAFRLLKKRTRLLNKSRRKGLKSRNLPSLTTQKASSLLTAMRRIVRFLTIKATTCKRRDLEKCPLPSNKNYNRPQ